MLNKSDVNQELTSKLMQLFAQILNVKMMQDMESKLDLKLHKKELNLNNFVLDNLDYVDKFISYGYDEKRFNKVLDE